MSSNQQRLSSCRSGIQRVGWLLAAGCCVLTTGCVRRSLTIRTNPPGALVYVNDDLKGKSPLTYDFVWYGWHRVMIRKDGYTRVDDRKLLQAPMYLWIPFDLAMELLPFPIHDRRTWSYTLTPAPTLPTPVPPPVTEPKAAAPSSGSPLGAVPTNTKSKKQQSSILNFGASAPPASPAPASPTSTMPASSTTVAPPQSEAPVPTTPQPTRESTNETR